MSPTPSASDSSDAGQTPINYLLWFTSFVCANALSMWGQFVTLKYPNMGMFAAYKMAIPFAWMDWLFMSMAINIGNKYKLVTPTQDTLMFITVQFACILIINEFYLHQPLFKSDIVAFFMIIFGFAVSFNNLLSKALNRSVPSAKPAPAGTPLTAPKGNRKKTHLLKHMWGIQPDNEYSGLTEGISLSRSE